MKVVEVYREIQDQQMNIVSFDCVYPALLILDSSLILNSKRGMLKLFCYHSATLY